MHNLNALPILILKPGKERSFHNKHPWLFSGAVKQLPHARDGDIVAVSDANKNVLGYGFYAPESQIVCRLFHFGNAFEDFTTEAYWMKKFESAFAIRKVFINGQRTDAYRLIHAEGDFFPGLIVDVYHDLAVVQLLVEGTGLLEAVFVKCLQNLGIKHIYLKSKGNTQNHDNTAQGSRWLTPPRETTLKILEHGHTFGIDVATGQKTGFFIDQRENRYLLQRLSAGRKVLNTFCYTGGFSVYAMAGGASQVISVDVSKTAITRCEENIALNLHNIEQHKAIAADCFLYLRENQETHDIIVVDPPAFAKNAKSVNNAARGYKDLNMLAFKKVNPQGMVITFSCSQHITKELFQKIVFAAAADAGRNVRILQHLTQPEDHPVSIYHPEGAYLKGLLLWVE